MYNFGLNSISFLESIRFWARELRLSNKAKNEHTRIRRLLHKMLFPPSELNQREMETLVGNLQATADGRLAIVELCLATVRYGHSLIIFDSVINELGATPGVGGDREDFLQL